MLGEQMKHIKLTIDESTLAAYEQHYFSVHKQAKKKPTWQVFP